MPQTQEPLSLPIWERLAKVAIGLLLTLPLMEWIYAHVPRLRPHDGTGIVSVVQLSGLDSRQNYLVFAACFAVLTMAAWGCAALLPRWSSPSQPGEGRLPQTSLGLTVRVWMMDMQPVFTRLSERVQRVLANRIAVAAVSCLLLGAWIINSEYRNLGEFLVHTNAYHEGEYLGFGPTLAKLGHPFTTAFYIHGFGINALPDLLAQQLGFRSNGIAAARLLRVLESSVAWLWAAWALFEIVRAYRSKGRTALPYLATLGGFLILSGECYELTLRRSVSLLQLATLFWLLRSELAGSRMRKVLLAFLLGCSLPLATLYDYSEAIWFLAIMAGTLPLVFVREGRAALPWVLASVGGMGAATLALWLGLGGEQFTALVGQIQYWAKYGREIWFLPLTAKTLHASKSFALLVLVPSLTMVYLLFRYRRQEGLRAWLQEHAMLLVLLVATLLGDRVALDRGIEEHLRWSGVNNTLLLAGLLWSMLRALDAESAAGLPRVVPRAVASLGAGLLLLTGAPRLATHLNPFSAFEHLRDYATSLRTPDDAILSGAYQEAREMLRSEVAPGSSFYVLTSDALWYRVFQTPSASRFHQLTYARAPEAQQEVIRSLETKRPTLVLVEGYGRMNGVPSEASTPLVYQYVLEHYRPYKQVGAYAFWKRAESSIWNRVTAEGVPGAIMAAVPKSPIQTQVSGYVQLPADLTHEAGMTLYLSTRKERRLVGEQALDGSEGQAPAGTISWILSLPLSPEASHPSELAAWVGLRDGRLMPVTPPAH